jgi:GTP-binding protein
MAGSEGRNPLDDLKALRKELELYNPELAARPWCIIANKMDMPEAAVHIKAFKKKYQGITILPICAELGEGIPELKAFLQEKAEEEEEKRKEAAKALQAADSLFEGGGTPLIY